MHSDLDNVREAFGGSVPRIFQAMHDARFLERYWPSLAEALGGSGGVLPPVVVHGLATVLSSKCGNSYCFVSHANVLHSLGNSLESIRDLLTTLSFPESVSDREKWNLVLRWAFLLAETPPSTRGATENSNLAIERITSQAEYRALVALCVAVGVLNRFAELYASHIQVDEEQTFLDEKGSLRFPIPELVTYWPGSLDHRDDSQPVVIICSWCRSIRDTTGEWRALETVLRTLKNDSAFSHGICPACDAKLV